MLIGYRELLFFSNLSKFYSKKLCVKIKMSIKMSIITIKIQLDRYDKDPIQYVMSYFPDGQVKEEITKTLSRVEGQDHA